MALPSSVCDWQTGVMSSDRALFNLFRVDGSQPQSKLDGASGGPAGSDHYAALAQSTIQVIIWQPCGVSKHSEVAAFGHQTSRSFEKTTSGRISIHRSCLTGKNEGQQQVRPHTIELSRRCLTFFAQHLKQTEQQSAYKAVFAGRGNPVIKRHDSTEEKNAERLG